MPPETSQTLDRGIRLIELLTQDRPEGWTVTDLAAALSVGRPVVYRLLATFEEHDLVRRTESGRIALGVGILRFSAAVHPTLRRLSAAVLRDLANDVGATSHLTIVEEGRALVIAVVEPTWTTYHVGYRVGSQHEIGAGAAGKAILGGRAGRPDAVLTIGELQTGAQGIAAPLLGVPGLEASVGVVSTGDLDVERVSAAVSRAAVELAASLVPAERRPAG